jgi:hypothetical protein
MFSIHRAQRLPSSATTVTVLGTNPWTNLWVTSSLSSVQWRMRRERKIQSEPRGCSCSSVLPSAGGVARGDFQRAAALGSCLEFR